MNKSIPVHIGHICQTARIVDIHVLDCLKTTDTALVTFQFLQRAEYVTPGARLLMREGKTKAIGQVETVSRQSAGELDAHRRSPKNSGGKATSQS